MRYGYPAMQFLLQGEMGHFDYILKKSQRIYVSSSPLRLRHLHSNHPHSPLSIRVAYCNLVLWRQLCRFFLAQRNRWKIASSCLYIKIMNIYFPLPSIHGYLYKFYIISLRKIQSILTIFRFTKESSHMHPFKLYSFMYTEAPRVGVSAISPL